MTHQTTAPTPGKRNPRELDMALSSTRQNVALLISQAKANQVDPAYLLGRLESLNSVLEQVVADRANVGDQQQLSALYEVSRAIGSSLDLQTVLNQVMDAIIQLTGAERGFLMLLDDDGNLVPRAARNIDQQTLESGDFLVSRTVTRQVVDSGQPVLTMNASEVPRFAGQASVIANALRSIMATSLRVRGQVIGVVYVDNRAHAGLFKPEDLAALDTFGGQAAVAIDNARLFSATDEALQARVEELSMLRRMDRELNEAIDARAVMDVTLTWSSNIAEANGGALGLIELGPEDQQVMHIARSIGNASLPKGLEEGASITLSEHSALGKILSGTDVQHRHEADGHALLFVPIHHENKPIGAIVLTADHDFSEEQRDLVMRMAARAAVAIQNTRLFEAVKAADKAKSEFVSVVAHELKVPMTSIAGYADLLKMMGEVTDQQEEFIEKIKNNVKRMKVLVSDLSDISRIESGNLLVKPEALDPHQIIREAQDGARTQIEERDHTLVEEIDDELPMVMADKTRLTQVLLNLLSNAYKYTPDGGVITLQAWSEGADVAFCVRDTGVGMTEEEVARLGTKFWRADNDHSINQPGTGLGFAITRNLITLMGGELSIESEPDEGSAFMFTIPVAK